MKLSILKIHEQAKDRPQGYVEDVLSKGIVEGDWLEISKEALQDLRDKYRPPTILQKAVSLTQAVVQETVETLQGKDAVSDEEQRRRLVICQGCEFFNKGTCSQCGCVLNWKTRMRSMSCPIDKW